MHGINCIASEYNSPLPLDMAGVRADVAVAVTLAGTVLDRPGELRLSLAS